MKEIQCGSKSYIFIVKADVNKEKLEVTLTKTKNGLMEELIWLKKGTPVEAEFRAFQHG